MRALRSSLGAALLALVLGGCSTTSPGGTSVAASDPGGQRYTSYIQIEGVIAGGAIKLNGSQVSSFPGWVSLEVDVNGKATRRYVVSLSTNIIDPDIAAYVIEQGEEAPAKIFYERAGPVATGTAKVQGRN
jgi:hypothetical protein